MAHSHLEVRPSTKNQAKTIKSGTLKGPHFLKTHQKFPKIQRTHKPSGTLRSLILPNVPAVFQGSREAYKPSGTPRSLILPNVPEVLKNPEKPTKPLVHIRGSLPSVPGVGYKDLIESLRRSAAMLPQSLRVHTLSDARRPL